MQHFYGITPDTKQHSIWPHNKVSDFIISITAFNGYRTTPWIFLQGEYFLLDVPVPAYRVGYGIPGNIIEIIFEFSDD
jgi:hypothetical protein